MSTKVKANLPCSACVCTSTPVMCAVTRGSGWVDLDSGTKKVEMSSAGPFHL